MFHIVDLRVWATAGETYTPAGYATDGFVHLSFAHQVQRVANALYRDADHLIVVEIDPTGLDLVVEDCYETGEDFPHVYQPLPTSSAVALHDMRRRDDGDWVFSLGDATDPASPDR